MAPLQVPSQTAKPNPHGRVFNFAAGPACLPLEVLETAQKDLLNWQGCGISVMELSHRSKEFTSILDKAEADLRQLLSIPQNYKVLALTRSDQLRGMLFVECSSKDAEIQHVQYQLCANEQEQQGKISVHT